MMKLLLLCGGASTEHEVSRMSCTNIRKNVPDTYDVTTAGITFDGDWYVLNDDLADFTSAAWLDGATKVNDHFSFVQGFDCVFPVLHGAHGEDGTLQGMLEMANVPYVGCRVLDSAAAMDKVEAKKIFAAAGIPQTPSLYVKKRYDGKLVVVLDNTSESEDIVNIVAEDLGFPVFVKASRSGSSVGCYKVSKPEDLIDKLEEAAVYDRKILVEKAVNCTELECAVLGNDTLLVSRVGQILPHGEFYTYESKYEDAESATCIPARVDESIQERIRVLAMRAFKAIDGHGLSRCDFFLDQDTGDVYLNEINTLPGFTNISMYPQLMNDAGVSTPELIDRLVALARER